MSKRLNSSLIRLCDLLSDGQWHDGNALGDALSLSRSGVWKGIKKLQQYEVPIHVKRGKGYQLTEPLWLLNPEIIKSDLTIPCECDVFESIPSTNDFLREIHDATFPRLCFAEEQVKGKGRLGRDWYSPFGKNIYMSCSYVFHKDMSELAGLSLVVSLAILEALTRFGIKDELLAKWPNDILYQGKKLAGTLIEIQAESNGATKVIVGVGLNVNLMPYHVTNEIDQEWTSVREITGKMVNRNELAVMLVESLFHYLQRFNVQGFSTLRKDWLEASQYLGKTIEFKNANLSVIGKVVDVNEQGHLVIEHDGKTGAYSAGDTTIIK